jgi:hypothetical protein
MGYAFINFMKSEYVVSFYKVWMNKRWAQFSSRKRCDLAFGRIQGKHALQQHFSNSRALLSAPSSCRPIVRADDDEPYDESYYPSEPPPSVAAPPKPAQLALTDAMSSAAAPAPTLPKVLSFLTPFVSNVYHISGTSAVSASNSSNTTSPEFIGGF